MRKIYKLSMLLAIASALLTFPPQAKTHERPHAKKTSAVASAKAMITQTSTAPVEPMIRMPLVLPLFVQDQQFTSTIVLVNGSAESAYADVASLVWTERKSTTAASRSPPTVSALLKSRTSCRKWLRPL